MTTDQRWILESRLLGSAEFQSPSHSRLLAGSLLAPTSISTKLNKLDKYRQRHPELSFAEPTPLADTSILSLLIGAEP
jgi:hypothetical protein